MDTREIQPQEYSVLVLQGFSLMKVSEKCICEADQDEFLTIEVLSNIEVEVHNDINENISDQKIENE